MRTFKSIEKAIKRTPVIKYIDLNDGEDPIKLTINPSEYVEEKILEIIFDSIPDEDNNKTVMVNLENKEIFIPIVQMITNIKLEKEEENDFMEYLFKDPSPEGKILRENILEVVNRILDNILKNIDDSVDETNNKLNNNKE